MVGLSPGTNIISYKNILNLQHPFLKFSTASTELYKRFPLDIKATLKQFTSIDSLKAIVKKIPYAGII
ncbi:transposase, partial [Bacillaceae bacterium Marseille-Q3522]|nr:transposase [Bacillaceae bacterium Marseille-Q3522]